MKKQVKKYTFILVLLIVLMIGGIFLSTNIGSQTASSQEIPNETSDPASSTVKENEASVEKTESSPVEESEESIESNDEEKESEVLEEVHIEEKVTPEEILTEEAVNENEGEQTNFEEEVSNKENSESKQNIESEQSTESNDMKPMEVIEESSIGMTEYLLPFSNSEERVKMPTHVMLHFTSNALNNPQDPYRIEDTYNIFKDYGVSANYVIGRNGEIYLFVPENRIAYHAGRGKLAAFPEYDDQLNHYSIGIELLAIGTREEMIPVISAEVFDKIDPALTGYTQAQYNSLNSLLNDILARNPNIKKDRNHIVGHDEYSVGTKTDPGSLFNWSQIGL